MRLFLKDNFLLYCNQILIICTTDLSFGIPLLDIRDIVGNVNIDQVGEVGLFLVGVQLGVHRAQRRLNKRKILLASLLI